MFTPPKGDDPDWSRTRLSFSWDMKHSEASHVLVVGGNGFASLTIAYESASAKGLALHRAFHFHCTRDAKG
jgi:hypothetical protein